MNRLPACHGSNGFAMVLPVKGDKPEVKCEKLHPLTVFLLPWVWMMQAFNLNKN